MSTTHKFAQDNVACLMQTLDLLDEISDDLFVKTHPPVFENGVGPHLRHILEHYLQFLAGWPSGKVDYDAREREVRIERDRDHAIAVTRKIMRQLEECRHEDGVHPLQIKMDCGGQQKVADWTESTVARELQFLASHTIHHHALIAAILRLVNHEPAESFGIAPSTLKHEMDRAQCAP